ncbi:MAG: alanine racemase [Oscillospiraceae bacterium]|nr:alanine racemase [Oscillospiraceae bacterium]
MEFAGSYARIQLDILRQNYLAIRQKAGAPVMAVVKADAYGHGAVAVAKHLENDCDFFGVANAAEALQLRKAGIETPILVLGRVEPQVFDKLVEENIRLTIFDYADAFVLSQVAVAQGKSAKFHIAVDTGMSRIGFQVTEEAADICQRICALPGLFPEGLFTHFATADTGALEKTHAQVALFREFDQMLQVRGIEVPIRHLDNSAGIMNFGAQGQMVRAGIVLYGLYPSSAVDRDLLPIRPVLSWHTQVSCVKRLPAGREISYGGTFVTEKDTVVATVSAGYADGYRRSLSGQFYVLIHGCKAPILGRICMDQFMVDVTEIPNVSIGDDVVLLGKSGELEISAEEIAEAAGSFNYEQLCNLSRRVTRAYYDADRELFRENFLLV